MSHQGELFRLEAPAVPGLLQLRDAVTAAEEAELAARIDAAPLGRGVLEREHSIVPLAEPRRSITFRTLRNES